MRQLFVVVYLFSQNVRFTYGTSQACFVSLDLIHALIKMPEFVLGVKGVALPLTTPAGSNFMKIFWSKDSFISASPPPVSQDRCPLTPPPPLDLTPNGPGTRRSRPSENRQGGRSRHDHYNTIFPHRLFLKFSNRSVISKLGMKTTDRVDLRSSLKRLFGLVLTDNRPVFFLANCPQFFHSH